MQKRIKIEDIILFVLMLAACNVFLYGTYLVIGAFFLLLFRDKKVIITNTGVILILFVLSYILFFVYHNGFSSSVFRCVILMLGYIIGYQIYDGSNFKNIEKSVLFCSVAMASHGVLNLLYSLSLGGTEIFKSGATMDFWSRQISSATGQAAYYYLLLGLLGYVFFSMEKGRNRRILMVLMIIIALHNLLLGGRVFILLAAVSVIVTVLVFWIYFPNKKIVFRIVISVTASILVVYLLYRFNIFNIKTMFDSSYFHYRFFSDHAIDFTDTSRWLRKIEYVKRMHLFPFGGKNIRVGLGIGYAHELWLDVFDEVGIIPYVLLIIYTFVSLKRCIKFVRGTGSIKQKILIGSIYTTLVVSFVIEPILDSCPMVVTLYCFIDGMLTKYMENGFLTEKQEVLKE